MEPAQLSLRFSSCELDGVSSCLAFYLVRSYSSLFPKSIRTLEIRCRHWSLAPELSLQLGSPSVGPLESPFFTLCLRPSSLFPGFLTWCSWFQLVTQITPGVPLPPTAHLQTITGTLELGCPPLLGCCFSWPPSESWVPWLTFLLVTSISIPLCPSRTCLLMSKLPMFHQQHQQQCNNV